MDINPENKILMQPDPSFPYFQAVDLPFALPTRIYGGMLTLWLLRPALQRRFPLHLNQRKDYLHFLGWCAMIGRRECQLLTEIPAWNQELQQPIELPSLRQDAWQGTFNVALYLIGLHRSKYWEAQIQGNTKLRHRTARWYFREGRQLLKLQNTPTWQQEALQKNFPEFNHFIQKITLPKDNQQTRQALLSNNQDLQQTWQQPLQNTVTIQPVSSGHTPATYLARQLAGLLPVEANQLLPLFKRKQAQPGTAEVTRVAKKINSLLPEQDNKKDVSTSDQPFGVNLYGYAKGELGIGEDVRMLAQALEEAKVPFCIINIELGEDVSQKDTSADGYLTNEPQYQFNIFCMTGIEMCRYVIQQGSQILEGHYNIGLWPWELPAWPEAWHHAWSLVDELWGISDYTAQAYAQAPVPVKPMPLPVKTRAIAAFTRKHWKLPEKAYLFVFSFDMNSRLTRKNPAAVIQAFKKASEGLNPEEVGLVLKISHLKQQNPEWQQLEKQINQDPRIHLITIELRRPEVLALYKNCNCYVSLHRSEGFGRGLAEAQLLGLQLIVTGYSGNMAFCQPPTQCVDYTLIPLQPGDYFYGDGQKWAEPDIKQAAQLMRESIKQGPTAQPLHYAVEKFSPAYCGQHYRQRLEEIRTIQ